MSLQYIIRHGVTNSPIIRRYLLTQVGSIFNIPSQLQSTRIMSTSEEKVENPDEPTGRTATASPGPAAADVSTLLKHHRYKDRLGGKLPPPGTIDVQVVGTGAMASPKSIIINTDHLRYLFNCGEGTQRLAMEHKMRISRVENIFLTHRSWQNIGGLLGMCLSLEGTCQVPKVTIHGPPGIENIATMSRGFSQLHVIEVEKREVSDEYTEDSAMRVEYIPLYPQHSPTSEEPAHKKAKPCPEDMSVVYLLKPQPKQRKLSIEKCVDLNVKSIGKHVKNLKDGESITLPDGRVIHPDDVLEPAEANNGILVIECPSEPYLESLVTNERLNQMKIDLVVHLTPPELMQHPSYQSWMKSLGEAPDHLIVNEEAGAVSSRAVFYSQAVLNQIHSDIFPLLHQQITQENQKFVHEENLHKELVGNKIYGKTNLRYLYRGGTRAKKGTVTVDQCVELNNEMFIKESMEDQDYSKELVKTQNVMKEIERSGKKYPEFFFTGTGSSVPNKARNVSGILMNIAPCVSMLLDCGEDTTGQLLRYYGMDQMKTLLTNIKAVFVSHLHADHHMGLIGLLKARVKALGDDAQASPLLILAPHAMADWLANVEENITPVENYCKLIPLESFSERPDALGEVCEALALKNFTPVDVIHRQYPHGVVITSQDGYKTVYSGDTRPSNKLIHSGKGCDLLIHEATMEDDLAAEAAIKRHSTTSQAIDVGQKMEARFTLLTHFSQRYAKIPIFNDKFTEEVGIAFDNMRVNPELLPFLPAMLPALKTVFAEHYAEMEEKQLKRQTQKEREGAEGKNLSKNKQKKLAKQEKQQNKRKEKKVKEFF